MGLSQVMVTEKKDIDPEMYLSKRKIVSGIRFWQKPILQGSAYYMDVYYRDAYCRGLHITGTRITETIITGVRILQGRVLKGSDCSCKQALPLTTVSI